MALKHKVTKILQFSDLYLILDSDQGLYCCWCKASKFLSMIPEDAKARHEEATANAKKQTQVNDHFHQVNPEDKPAPYSDELFKAAAIQWLIETDQVIFYLHTSQCISFSIYGPDTGGFCPSAMVQLMWAHWVL